MHFIFIIYSCKKYLHKSKLLYELVYNKIPQCKPFIIYGEPDLETEFIVKDDKYIILKSGDHYENLCEKTIKTCKAVYAFFPNAIGMFKCDDDIIPNIQHIEKMIAYIQENNIQYMGNKCNNNECLIQHHYHKCSNDSFNVPKLAHTSIYCTGPIYYLNKYSVGIVANITNHEIYFNEDIMVGHVLNSHDIIPTHYKTYYDEFENRTIGCYQNYKNQNKLFVKLQGGLGNQLFQVAAARELANRNNMLLVLLYTENYQHIMTHNTCADEFMRTFFSKFNYAIYENVETSNVKTYNESRCFDYDPNIIRENADYLLNGYFQNRNYISDLQGFISCIENKEMANDLLQKYPLLESSYFIHVRRGDYLIYNKLYSFDTDSYYSVGIQTILKKENTGSHFFIFSDDTEFVENYPVFECLNKTVVKCGTTIEDFYMMGLCKKGGICANSTFSGWASNMNRNPDKIVIIPEKWINIDYSYEIPFEYTHKL